MPILDAASAQDIKRLVELFPVANLRQAWPAIKGTKDELCFAVAEHETRSAIASFVNEHVGCCKQHVYIFARTQDDPVVDLPENLADAERRAHVPEASALYVIRVRYSVVLKEPLEETVLDFLWPVRLELSPALLLVHFVVLEKNLSSYFERPCYVGRRSIEESDVLQELAQTFKIEPCDLHKGIKQLWDDGFMDSPKAKYKKPISLASESMDEERGIKEYNPELYAILQESVLLNTLFVIPEDKGHGVSVLMSDPSKGYLSFPRYCEEKGGAQYVIEQILGHNQ